MLLRAVLVARAGLGRVLGWRGRAIGSIRPPAGLLLPLGTALERELGLRLRAAKEVEEIAEDIRRELLARPNDGGQRP